MKKELRLVLTRKCNYECYFCHGEGVSPSAKELMVASDYKFLIDTCKKAYNWETVTLTGGEPFFRKDINNIITEINECGVNITVVTNGALFDKHIDSLKNVERINISIHSLNKEKYQKIVGKNQKLEKVVSNLFELRNKNPKIEIRINTTIVKGINDTKQDIKELINFASQIDASIKFVELFSNKKEEIISINDTKDIIMDFGYKIKDQSTFKTTLYNGNTEIILTKIFCAAALEYYNPNSFCNANNDLFVTCDGKIKLCRYSNTTVSILDEVKNRDVEGLKSKIQLANNLLGKNCILYKEKSDKLAIYGGKPILENGAGKFNHPVITKKIEEAVIEQLHDTISIYDNSNIFKKFETEFAKYHNKTYGIVTNSGTTALWSLYDAINLKKGDEVIVPIYTFFATVTPIFQTGATPIFVDCDETGNIDYKKIEEKITPNTKAIMVTHMWGYPCKMDELRRIADKYDIYLLEDCSHAHGGSYKGKKLGEWSDAAAFSLQGQKIITGGEGGIVITNNKHIYKNCILLGHYNKRCKNEIDKNSNDYLYAVTGKGMKLRAHPLAIRIAYEMFKDLDKINKIKQYYASIIKKTVDRIDGLSMNKSYEGSVNSWYGLIIKYDASKFNNTPIEKFNEALIAEGGIEFDIPGSTCPLNRLPLFQKPDYFFKDYDIIIKDDEKFLEAEKFYSSIIKLPVWYHEEDINIVLDYCEILKKVSKYFQEGGK